MKRFISLIALILIGGWATAAQPPVGTSLGVVGGGFADDQIQQVKDAGIEYVEVVLHRLVREYPESEWYSRAFELRERLDRYGIKVWSCHLPFGKTWDISVLDPVKNEKYVAALEKMIDLAGIFNPQRLILHPASKPLPEEDRFKREAAAANAICRLSIAAGKIGAVLCVENMPNSIGRTAEEMHRLVDGAPEVMVCLDVNHLLDHESPTAFWKGIGDRIKTVHVSDNDGVDERHWCPGAEKGVIDWPAYYAGMKDAGYKGVFIFEVHPGAATPKQLVEAYNMITGKPAKKSKK